MTDNAANPTFLVASPQLLDPNFAQSVVLVAEHGDDGTHGFVVNRPLGRELGEVVPGLEAPLSGVPLFDGGPVARDHVQLIGRGLAGPQLLPGLQLAVDLSDAEGSGQALRAFVGYAGWSPGQLADETAEGAWIVAPARTEHLLEVPAAELWSQVLRELGGNYAWMGLDGSSPQDN